MTPDSRLSHRLTLCALGVLCAIGATGIAEQRLSPSNMGDSRVTAGPAQDDGTARVISQLQGMLPGMPESDIQGLAANYGNMAVNITKQHGRQGAEVLQALGQQGAAILREQPEGFTQISKHLGGNAAATFLVFMHDHFADLALVGGLPQFLDRVEALPEKVKQTAIKYPQLLPFLILSPEEVNEAFARHPDICLVCLPLVDLRKGPSAVGDVARMIIRLGVRAKDWVGARGLDGLLLADKFSHFLDRKPPTDLAVFLEILSSNQDDIEILVACGKADQVRLAIGQLARADRSLPENPSTQGAPRREGYFGDLIKLACSDSHTVRFLVEHGAQALNLITATWPQTAESGESLPSVLYEGYGRRHDDPRLLEHAWQALAEQPGRESEVFQMLMLMAGREGQDPARVHPRSQRFCQLLTNNDYRVVLYLAEAELLPQLTENHYALLKERGSSALDDWSAPRSLLVQSVPLYDVVHLGWVLAHGYPPTQGEILFACIDAAFTAWDLATLGGGKVASIAVTIGQKVAGKKAVEEVGEAVARQMAKGASREANEQAKSVFFARLAKSPQVVAEVAKNRLSHDLQVGGALAWRSAAKRRLPLTLLRYSTTTWAVNVAVGRGFQELVAQASKTDNRLWSAKTREVLLYLGSVLERPVGAGQ